MSHVGLAILFVMTVVCAGFATLRVLGIAKGAVALGLVPAAGVSLLVTLATWGIHLGVPPPVPGLGVLGIAVSGLALGYADRQSLGEAVRTLVREQTMTVVVFGLALAIPFVVIVFGFPAAAVPLSPHDGAFHTEAIQQLRSGGSGLPWYPPGLAALFAAFLQLLPWIDSAQGALELGLSLPALAILAVFGLSASIWRDLRIAAAAALLLSFTYLYPYFPQIWSGWPLALSLILVIGVWTIALEFLDRPALRWAVLAGEATSAIVLVHGTEVYTLALVLAIVLFTRWRRVHWSTVAIGLAVALSVAVLCTLVYLPTLLRWGSNGGAYAAGTADGPSPQTVVAVASSSGAASLLSVFTLASLGIDLPIRVALVVIGAVWAARAHRGLSVVVIGLLFLALAYLFNLFIQLQAVRHIYALVFPWAMHYRLLMLVTIAQVLLGGAGAVLLLGWLDRFSKRPTRWARTLGRAMRLLVITWIGLTAWATTTFLALPAARVVGYSDDDQAAMAWLREHARADEVLVNDGYADAGIWAPFKAGVLILLPRSAVLSEDDRLARWLVINNVSRLENSPEATVAACARGVAFVYHGATSSEWDTRHFASLADLRASADLQEVFGQGDAVVFRTRLGCPSRG